MLSDRVFGPTTTTRHVYDIAAQHVISGAMEGINGNLFIFWTSNSIANYLQLDHCSLVLSYKLSFLYCVVQNKLQYNYTSMVNEDINATFTNTLNI